MCRSVTVPAIALLIAAGCGRSDSVVVPGGEHQGSRTIGGVTVREDGRVIYKLPDDFVETSRSHVKGIRGRRGGCGFHSHSTLRGGQQQSLVTVEFDPKTCDYVVAVGYHRVVGGTAGGIFRGLRHASELQGGQSTDTFYKASLPAAKPGKK